MFTTDDLCTFPVLVAVVVVVSLWILRQLFTSGQVGNLQDKFVLITGCDSGFGRETAIKLDEMGVNVLATCLTADGERALQQACSSKIKTFRLDLTKSEEIKDVYRAVQGFLPENTGLWGLVNNAGIAQIGPVDWIPVQRFKDVADVLLWGLIDVTKTFLPLIKKTKGRIVNVTSIGGRTTLPNAVAYSVSKYGAEAFSDGIRRELGPFGISVSIVEPGFFRTNLTSRANLENQWRQLWEALDDDKREEYGIQYYNTSVQNMLVGMVDTCSSPNTYKVIDVIIHAVTSSSPKARYVVGWDSKLLWIWLSWLPTTLGDAVLTLLGEKTVPQRVA